jgi:hypothetical protein
MDDKDSEQAVTNLENECNDVLFCSASELFDWSSTSHRRKLAFYIAFTYARATQRRSHSKKIGLDVYNELRGLAADLKLMQELADAANQAVRRSVFTADSMRERVLEVVREGTGPAETNTAFVSNLRSLTDYLAGFLLQKHWQVWRAPDGIEFVTSDNPAINSSRFLMGPSILDMDLTPRAYILHSRWHPPLV